MVSSFRYPDQSGVCGNWPAGSFDSVISVSQSALEDFLLAHAYTIREGLLYLTPGSNTDGVVAKVKGFAQAGIQNWVPRSTVQYATQGPVCYPLAKL